MDVIATTAGVLMMIFGPVQQGWRELPSSICYRAYHVNLDGVMIDANGHRLSVIPRCVVKS